ncbi:hypothetical protein BHE74_00028597 [Ensete ventricosum]|nr:hypothetical protein BHE74_00028597 [Ensete ventricosum]
MVVADGGLAGEGKGGGNGDGGARLPGVLRAVSDGAEELRRRNGGGGAVLSRVLESVREDNTPRVRPPTSSRSRRWSPLNR